MITLACIITWLCWILKLGWSITAFYGLEFISGFVIYLFTVLLWFSKSHYAFNKKKTFYNLCSYVLVIAVCKALSWRLQLPWFSAYNYITWPPVNHLSPMNVTWVLMDLHLFAVIQLPLNNQLSVIFISPDINCAYILVLIREGDKWKLAFSMSSGHYE